MTGIRHTVGFPSQSKTNLWTLVLDDGQEYAAPALFNYLLTITQL